MDVDTLITQALSRMDNVGAADAANAERRTRYVEWVVESVEELRGEREWTWVQKESSAISVTAANAYASLPANFHAMGETGVVIDVATGDELEWTDPKSIIASRRGQVGTVTTPEVYSIFDLDATTGQALIQFPPLGANISVRVLYLAAAPTLDDSTNKGNLKFAVPVHYHQTLLIPLLRHKSQMSKGDGRASEWFGLYQAALKRAIRREFPAGKQSSRGLRSFFGS